ncbi:PREDICTED: RNA-binding protein 42-like isoform X2 [Nicotiana attenuata]|uniref:RNA-binding protein 42-like isoform X2 n=1 Tax=Nicotiana attenuata TaxID=49451 RepID=UPI0009049D30|nr:PREDICTED: RNA-binding protein 42-like isoform X2 [Nicotiana attenuata]XP_019254319.1 PREDICTED: RNA-binding protein 42-like isoform X2 [Nicotiana attenuata]
MSTVTSTPAAAAYSSQYNYLNGTYFPTPFHLQQQPSQPYIGPAPPVYSAPASVPGVYTLPQYQQAQQLFQRVAQTITPEAIENVKAALAKSEIEQKAEAKKKAVPRKAAGQTWEDPTLADWPENDYRIFCGNLGNEVNDDVLSKAFSRFPSFNMARVGEHPQGDCIGGDLCPKHLGINNCGSMVVRDKRTGKTKGYGFVSFSNPSDLVTALKETNGLRICLAWESVLSRPSSPQRQKTSWMIQQHNN